MKHLFIFLARIFHADCNTGARRLHEARQTMKPNKGIGSTHYSRKTLISMQNLLSLRYFMIEWCKMSRFKVSLVALLLLLFSSLGCLAVEEESKVKKETPYPRSTCVISENPLGVMGPPFIIQHHGTEVRFCCEECVKDFNKDPEKYLKKIHESSQ